VSLENKCNGHDFVYRVTVGESEEEEIKSYTCIKCGEVADDHTAGLESLKTERQNRKHNKTVKNNIVEEENVSFPGAKKTFVAPASKESAQPQKQKRFSAEELKELTEKSLLEKASLNEKEQEQQAEKITDIILLAAREAAKNGQYQAKSDLEKATTPSKVVTRVIKNLKDLGLITNKEYEVSSGIITVSVKWK
jgi:hypothetical protein